MILVAFMAFLLGQKRDLLLSGKKIMEHLLFLSLSLPLCSLSPWRGGSRRPPRWGWGAGTRGWPTPGRTSSVGCSSPIGKRIFKMKFSAKIDFGKFWSESLFFVLIFKGLFVKKAILQSITYTILKMKFLWSPGHRSWAWLVWSWSSRAS